MRWQPKSEALTLDGIKPYEHLLFRYILTRNGHNVRLYGGWNIAEADRKDRAARFPEDDWAVIDRGVLA